MTTPLPPQPPRATDLVDPTDAEIQEWADRERQRRASWLEGPTQDQKAEWARRERERRERERQGQPMLGRGFALSLSPDLPFRYARTAQLAGEGALSLMWKWSQQGLQTLVNEGRSWEDEFAPRGPRRVRVDDRTLE